MSASKMAASRKADRVVATKRKELAALDDEFFGLHKQKLVQELAFALHCPYEDVLPKVDAVLTSARPIDRKQRMANRKAAAPRIRAAIEALKQRFGSDAKAGSVRPRRRGGRA